jgi:hypothetical protein
MVITQDNQQTKGAKQMQLLGQYSWLMASLWKKMAHIP